MKKNLLFVLLLVSFFSFSQEDAWVYFRDKPNAQSYLNNPLTMLSQRALDRRIMQNIALVVNDVPVHQPYVDLITASNGIEVKAKSKWLNCLHVRGSQQDISVLINNVFVEKIIFANKNIAQLGKSSGAVVNIAINKPVETTVNYNYGSSANQIQMLNGHILHQQNFTGSGKMMAILDSGFTNVNTIAPFQRIRDNNQLLGGYNFVDRNTIIYGRHNHGTNVLSTIAGYVDNQLVGTAPDAQFYLFITEDINSENPVEESYWVEAAEMADSLGVDVIHSSLGYFGYDNPNYSYLYSDMTGNKAFASKGANIAFSKGMIVVCSAGNEGNSAEPHVGVPAEATYVIAVGAVKADRTIASFSSIGPSFDGRVKPDVMAQGQAAVVASTSGAIATANGTSFSGPIFAGMITSLWQAIPTATNIQVVDFVKQASDRFANPTAQYGYGIPNFQIALNTALSIAVPVDLTDKIFSIIPNPFDTKVVLHFPANYTNGILQVFSVFGQEILVLDGVKPNKEVDLSTLQSGVYYYKFQSSDVVITGKILKK